MVSGITGRKSRSRSCTNCRQQKIKCNAVEARPAPCDRCRRLGIDCQIDPHFKRSSTNARLDMVANKIQELENVISKSGGSSPIFSNKNPLAGNVALSPPTSNGSNKAFTSLSGSESISSNIAEPNSGHYIPTVQRSSQSVHKFGPFQVNDMNCVEPKTLANITFESADIRRMFLV